jgi:hypothetical protein
MFNPQIFEELDYYVYGLQDPRNKQFFYIGKGAGNRVFQHLEESNDSATETKKLNKIREIERSGYKVEHIIIRHGLTEAEAFTVESTLIDIFLFQSLELTNLVVGHHTREQGIRTVNEIYRLYAPEDLDELMHPVAIININKRYKRGRSMQDVYEAVRESWVISESRRNTVEYVLAEYLGRIVGVFKVKNWYQCSSSTKSRRYGFVREDQISNAVVTLYLNKSVKKYKKRGQANPITYKL